jgi:hypothetical protein
MVVKFLSSTSTFKGVSYNTNKIERDKGELMKVENFDQLKGLRNLKPQDYSNYLKLIASQRNQVSSPQLHVAISCKGKEYNKYELTDIAVEWLGKMGYAKNPYMIIFHKDTDNNHVHVVSSRIDKEGNCISDSFEKNRAVQYINQIVGNDIGKGAKQDIDKALSYNFSTKAQFMMLLENKGYNVITTNDKLEVTKFGKKLEELPLSHVNDHIKNFTNDDQRIIQIRAIIEKYKGQYDTSLNDKSERLPGGLKRNSEEFTSQLSDFLKDRFGLQLIYHVKGDNQPYGYTVLDHGKQNVFKGSDIIKLNDLLKPGLTIAAKIDFESKKRVFKLTKNVNREKTDYYSALVKAAVYNYPDFKQGLSAQGLAIYYKDRIYIEDQFSGDTIPLDDLLDKGDSDFLKNTINKTSANSINKQDNSFSSPIPAIHLSGDIDDEQINGRNRKRQGKPNKNTR